MGKRKKPRSSLTEAGDASKQLKVKGVIIAEEAISLKISIENENPSHNHNNSYNDNNNNNNNNNNNFSTNLIRHHDVQPIKACASATESSTSCRRIENIKSSKHDTASGIQNHQHNHDSNQTSHEQGISTANSLALHSSMRVTSTANSTSQKSRRKRVRRKRKQKQQCKKKQKLYLDQRQQYLLQQQQQDGLVEESVESYDDETQNEPWSYIHSESDINQNLGLSITSNDCYDRMLFGTRSDHGDDYETSDPAHEEFPSNWFNTICYLTNSNRDNRTIIETSSKGKPSSSPQLKPTQPVQLHKLQTELNQIKLQLWPAAIRCARACNFYSANLPQQQQHQQSNIPNYHYGINKIPRTTPKKEFEIARTMCNPFECLGETRWKINNTNVDFDAAAVRNEPLQQDRSNKHEYYFRFVCRSALKLACIDSILGFPLTRRANSDDKCNDYHIGEQSDNTSTPQLTEWSFTHAAQRSPSGDRAHETGKKKNKNQSSSQSTPFVFVDLCGAPGGFSEYIMHRFHSNIAAAATAKTFDDSDDDNVDESGSVEIEDGNTNKFVSCKGYGMSLAGTNEHGRGLEWKLDHLKKFKHDVGAHFRICYGVDGTGDLYNWDNVVKLRDDILFDIKEECGTDNNGLNQNGGSETAGLVDLVVGDGGFDAQRDSNDQESLAHKLVVCQTAAALLLLKRGGNFVVKMFGFRMVGTREHLLRHLIESFQKIVILKPVASRPASAERYVVCLGYHGTAPGWNALKWRNQTLSSTATTVRALLPNVEDQRTSVNKLDYFLDEFDRDMLMINIKACKSIISCLEVRGNYVKRGNDVKDNPSMYFPRRIQINPNEYQSIWKIGEHVTKLLPNFSESC